jgi:branched-chain amino acid transport system substrate-binding protein
MLALVLAVVGGLAAPATPADPIKVAFIDPLSGAFAATGESGSTRSATRRRHQQGGGVLGRQIEIVPLDNKASPQESLIQLKKVIGDGIPFVFQGNSSGVAHAISDAVQKHNERNAGNRVLYVNYSAVDPALTNEKCHFWHFRFDAHADMKMAALTDVIAANKNIKKIYIIGQDYSFGKAVAEAAVAMLGKKRPDIQIVGNELHPIGKVKDFSPYVQKILASGADAVITGNWGADMLGLAKAGHDGGLKAPFYTYYAASNGITAAIGAAGVDRVRLVHETHPGNPNAPKALGDYITGFRKLHPQDDINQPRIHTALNMLAQAIKRAGNTDADKVAAALEGAEFTRHRGRAGHHAARGSPAPDADLHLGPHQQEHQVRPGRLRLRPVPREQGRARQGHAAVHVQDAASELAPAEGGRGPRAPPALSMLQLIVFSVLNGLVFGMLLFMLSSGLTLIFGMMGVLNFAHASFYMLGAYFAYTLGLRIGFWPALIVAPILVGLLGALVERMACDGCTASATWPSSSSPSAWPSSSRRSFSSCGGARPRATRSPPRSTSRSSTSSARRSRPTRASCWWWPSRSSCSSS